MLTAACHCLSLDVLEQISGSVPPSFDWKMSPVLYDFRVWAGQRQQRELTHFVFSLRPSMVSSFPNDLFGIYQQ